jgi:elongation factor G
VPIGAEADFKGVVDLINNRGMVWNEADQGMTWSEVPIPEDLKETVKEWRDKLIEAVAESDDKLMEKYFADPDSLTEAEVMAAIRKSAINMSITPILCGSAFKNKGVQTMLDAVMAYLPSPMDIEAVTGIDPAPMPRSCVVPIPMSLSLVLPSRSRPIRSWAVWHSSAPTAACWRPVATC